MLKKPFAISTPIMEVASCALVMIAMSAQLSAQERHPPFRMKLLPGYKITESEGIDTKTGVISKRGVPRIQYDMAGSLPSKDNRNIKPVGEWHRECSWKKNSYPDAAADTADVVCWLDMDENSHGKTLHVSFPDQTGFWTKVKNQRQIDEALKMILTYDPRT